MAEVVVRWGPANLMFNVAEVYERLPLDLTKKKMHRGTDGIRTVLIIKTTARFTWPALLAFEFSLLSTIYACAIKASR